MRSTVAFHARGTNRGLGNLLDVFDLLVANCKVCRWRVMYVPLRLEIARLIQFCHE